MTLNCRLVMLTILIVLAGCDPPDQRLVDFAEQANQQQGRAAAQVARQRGESAAARGELREATARSREGYREKQWAMDQQRQQLHEGRRKAAQAAAREP